MKNQPYYLAYEKRYWTVFEAGAERWGHSPEDLELYNTLNEWVAENDLIGKNVIEFACGEGAGGVILSRLGCNYYGVDIAPSAVKKAQKALKDYPNARVGLLDMVRETVSGQYDAALDCMGFHMLVTDGDRKAYLKNAFSSLNSKAPMLFYKEAYRNNGNVVKVPVESYDEWLEITGDDYVTPTVRNVAMGKGDIQVMVPFVPARANNKEGYMAEMKQAGFLVENWIEMSGSNAIQYAASIYVRKP